MMEGTQGEERRGDGFQDKWQSTRGVEDDQRGEGHLDGRRWESRWLVGGPPSRRGAKGWV